jgi:hypothetical protein
MALRLSSFLEEKARNTAKNMMAGGLSESKIPELPSCTLSRTDVCPEGYAAIGDITEQNVKFYLFQRF